MSFLPRAVKPRVLEALKVNPVVFVNGPRQAGKSTLMHDLAQMWAGDHAPSTYISFDQPVAQAAAASAPHSFLSAYPGRLILDEIQAVPELFPALKIAVDELRQKQMPVNGSYLLTGSANIMAFPQLADALVGRMSILSLYPFTTAEALSLSGRGLETLLQFNFSGLTDPGLTLHEAIRAATFPELLDLPDRDRQIWFDGYIITLLHRDIRMLADLEKITLLPHLLRSLAARTGSTINDADIARSVGLNPVTGKFYRKMLMMMFLHFEVTPWFRNMSKRLVKSPKGYFTDTSLLAHMLDIPVQDMEQQRPELFGHVLENYVATELIKQISVLPRHVNLHHFRTGDGKEIDFILESPDGSLIALEVKRSQVVRPRDFDSIRLFASVTGSDFKGGIVLYDGKQPIPFGPQLWAVPFHVLWQ